MTFDEIRKAAQSAPDDSRQTLIKCAEDWEQMRAALLTIKMLVTGDRMPSWKDDWATTCSRVKIADICDNAR